MTPGAPPQMTIAGDSLALPLRFVGLMAAWTLALLAVIRLPWIENSAIQALIYFQRTLAEWYGATATSAVVVNRSCSGADQIALCVGVTLAYPVVWSRRLVGAAGGLTLVLVLNTLRIGTLLTTARVPGLFDALHLYVWPAVLMVAVLLYALAWIRWADDRTQRRSSTLSRFGALASLFLLAYAALVPWMFSSVLVQRAEVWTARTGAMLLSFAGTVSSRGSMLVTSRGAFLVTQECLLTPLIPLYLAAAVAWPQRRSRQMAALAAALPLFFALGVLRLLVLAAPPSLLEAPIVVVHGFFQLVLGVLLICTAAVYGSSAAGRPSARATVVSLAAAVGAAVAIAPWWNPVVTTGARMLLGATPHVLPVLQPPGDAQGALVLLPVYQIALMTGLWLALARAGPARYCGALASLFVAQILTLIAVGEFEAHAGIRIHAIAVRSWAIVAPGLVTLAWMQRSKSSALTPSVYRDFWHDVGTRFPSLTGAPSTGYYFSNEVRLLTEQLPNLSGCTLLKTDLWDEAKNTRILQWAAGQGARVFGIDISAPIAAEAKRAFDRHALGASLADVRVLPFADGTFDAIYSMGTIEHFPESERAVHELARVLKPGGRLILGVPNLHDPFLRPLLVWLLHRIGQYAYGDERAFSRRSLRTMLEGAGLDVIAESGILFMPGWLRMLDLWCHTRARALTRLTGPMVAFFETIDRHFPSLRRHGYLLASVGLKHTGARYAPASTEEA